MQHHSVCVFEAVSSATLHPLIGDRDVLWSDDAQILCRSGECR